MAIAVVGTGVSGTGDGSSASLSLGAKSVSTGNFLCAGSKWETSVTLSSITDTAGNSYTLGTAEVYDTTEPRCQLGWSTNIAAHATNVIQFNYSSGATFRRGFGHEFSGVATSSVLDTQTTTQGDGSGNPTTSAFSTVANEELVFFLAGLYGAETFSSPLVGGNAATAVATALSDAAAYYYITAAPISSGTCTVSTSSTNIWVIAAAAFNALTGVSASFLFRGS